ncbi:MAG: hypothetical protein RI563_13325 [Thiohalophilus sp.]|uniref:hypothetical protein n=1 Tax=Thiohalophilus sp. TaxID=3028392 RepID=UPI0028701874|nr:hypothetical protein [Thiohalophilus sp.]MDR9437857.1 hypothetical protein [Thiohalophilus sp.]
MQIIKRYVMVPLFFAGLLLAQPALAEDRLQKADSAVANVLFDYDGSFEFASYKVDENGFVDITFASNTPDALYGEILDRLQNHPDISSVLAGKGGPTCSLF